MDILSIKERLSAPGPPNPEYLREASNQVSKHICDGDLKIIDLVQSLDSVLTSCDHEIRSKGVEILVQVITYLPKDSLFKEEIETLCEFVCLRLIDHKSMQKSTLNCLSYFVDCNNKPPRFNKTVLDFLKTKINVQQLDADNRALVYEIIRKIIMERRSKANSIDSDLVYSLVHLIEGESNPANLLLCFKLVSYVLKNFEDLEPFIDDLFDWMSSYYPIDYTPLGEDNPKFSHIERSDLVEALYECFYANKSNADNLQTLLLEHLDSNRLSSKLESLECLIKCYQEFPLLSVKKFSTSLWATVRMDCLKKISMVDAKLLSLSCQALSALTTKLSEDDETYFTFITDMFEELNVAFIKPEMDMFEPAARLVCHAVQPRLLGFNYILAKLMPIALNASSCGEFRPFSGLAYIFEQIHQFHPKSSLNLETVELIDRLVLRILELVEVDSSSLRLLNAIIRYKTDLNKKVFSAINTRYNKNDLRRYILLCMLSIQIPDLSAASAEKDFEWLMREVIRLLCDLKEEVTNSDMKSSEGAIYLLYNCIDCLIQKDNTTNLAGLLGSLIDLNLFFAQESKKLKVRKTALACLFNIATSFKHSELLPLRQTVVHRLKPCLSDKKRIVRQIAASARLRWVLVGQPIGS